MRGPDLFDKIVGMCGVSTVLAPGIVRRSLLDGKVRVEEAHAADYRAAMPRLERRIAAYLGAPEAARAARRIVALLDDLESDDDEEDSQFFRAIEVLRSANEASPERRELRQSGERTRDGAVPREGAVARDASVPRDRGGTSND